MTTATTKTSARANVAAKAKAKVEAAATKVVAKKTAPAAPAVETKVATPKAKKVATPKNIAPINRGDNVQRRHYGEGAKRHLQNALPQSGHFCHAMIANPYKDGSKAAKTFALFTTADGLYRTVAEVKALIALKPDAYDAGYIRYASRDGYLRFETEQRRKAA